AACAAGGLLAATGTAAAAGTDDAAPSIVGGHNAREDDLHQRGEVPDLDLQHRYRVLHRLR
ncbi:hypothetical protein, partial [Amycolatopsis vastitatis]|uniref:hypothetical protein n=1 Tax=Amycolatopsis vastitatis TaxID=1905142 RepID=UPI00196AFB8A